MQEKCEEEAGGDRARDMARAPDAPSGRGLPYGTIQYWNERYERDRNEAEMPAAFEWYGEIAERILLGAMAESTAQCEGPILEIGCGSSMLASAVVRADSSHATVTVTDASEAAMSLQLGSLTRDVRGRLDLAVMDALHLPIRDGTYAAVLDKGTLDALDCSGAWVRACERSLNIPLSIIHVTHPTSSFADAPDPRSAHAEDGEEDHASSRRLVSEVARVLDDDGRYYLVSCRERATRQEDVRGFFEIVSAAPVTLARGVPPNAYVYVLKPSPSE